MCHKILNHFLIVWYFHIHNICPLNDMEEKWKNKHLSLAPKQGQCSISKFIAIENFKTCVTKFVEILPPTPLHHLNIDINIHKIVNICANSRNWYLHLNDMKRIYYIRIMSTYHTCTLGILFFPYKKEICIAKRKVNCHREMVSLYIVVTFSYMTALKYHRPKKKPTMDFCIKLTASVTLPKQ